jgi:hypothetical protein
LNKRRYFVIIITSKAIKDSEGYAGGIGAENLYSTNEDLIKL